MSVCLPVSHQDYWKDFTNLGQKFFCFFLTDPFLGVLIRAEAILWFSGDLHQGINYYQAIHSLTIELSLSIKSSPLYPLLEMKLQGLSFISVFIKKNFNALPFYPLACNDCPKNPTAAKKES